jgi:hypothetical protein
MISDRGMSALRQGAALVRAVPQVRLRLRDGDRTLLDVGRPPMPDTGSRQVSPCAFHGAVARAHDLRAAGIRLRFLSLPPGVDPAVDVGVPPADEVLPGGIVRAAMAGVWVFALPVAGPVPALDGDVGLHVDAAVDVTVVHAEAPLGDRAAARRAQAAVEAAAARCAVAELEASLLAGA